MEFVKIILTKEYAQFPCISIKHMDLVIVKKIMLMILEKKLHVAKILALYTLQCG
jgi:hypothetical protein